MRIYLIRHGESANNALFSAAGGGLVDGYPGRVPDPELTGRGHRQAAALAEAIRRGSSPLVLTHLYASLTLRAVQTAAPVAAMLELPVRLRDDLHEVGGIHRAEIGSGIRHPMPGRTVRQLQEACPRAVPPAGYDLDRPWPGGFETEDEALPRAGDLLAALCRTHDGTCDVVGLVTHQHFSQFLLARVLGLSGPPWRRFRIDNTAHVALEVDQGVWHIEWLNRSDHLPAEEVTN